LNTQEVARSSAAFITFKSFVDFNS
jgi:hypothetical protein